MKPGTMIEMSQWALKYGRAVDFHNERTRAAAIEFQYALDVYAKELKKDALTYRIDYSGREMERKMRLIELKKNVIAAFQRFMQSLNDSLERFQELEKGIYKLPEG